MSRGVWLGVVVLFFGLLTLSIVWSSTDPGIRGTLADIGFFGSVLVGIFLIVSAARAIARRYRQS